jgi:uncharacterized protein (TIGR02186 family)
VKGAAARIPALGLPRGRHLAPLARGLILALCLLWPGAARAVDEPGLAVALSQPAVQITTGFSGAVLTIFGSTGALLGPGGDEVLVVVRGPTRPVVVRRKEKVLGFLWVNGPSARFPEVPGFYAIAGTRPVWQVLPEPLRQQNGLGLDALPLTSTGARSPAFRAALLELERQSGLWKEQASAVEIIGGRLFQKRLDLPATVPTGTYRVEVLLARSGLILARQDLAFEVERVGAADRIATIAADQPLAYGVLCIVLATLAGWVGSVLFRRS